MADTKRFPAAGAAGAVNPALANVKGGPTVDGKTVYHQAEEITVRDTTVYFDKLVAAGLATRQ